MNAIQTRGPGTVTVLVPAYQPNHRFQALLQSLAAQTYEDIVIRVSLDHAPDQPDPPIPHLNGKAIELLRQPQRLGWVGNVNALLATIDTPYFELVMHDDCISPTYIEAAVHAMRDRPEVVSAHGSIRYHVLREGTSQATDSITGDRMQRVMTFLDRGPHLAGMPARGVIRTGLLAAGLPLRQRRSATMFNVELQVVQLLAYGETLSVDGIFYDKYTDPDGLSRRYHGRTRDERSAMLADSLGCLIDLLRDTGFAPDEQRVIVTRWAEWLLGLQGNWNVVADSPNSDGEHYQIIRPALARFVADAALSVAWNPGDPQVAGLS